MKDSQIWAVLENLYPGALEDMPLDGEWLQPPFSDDGSGRAIVCNDGDFQFVVVDRNSSAVLFVCEDDESIISSKLETFPAIVTAWGAIDSESAGPEDDADFSEVKKSFETALQSLDPAAAGPNEFWALYTDELTNEDYVDFDELPEEEEDEPVTDTGDNDRPGADESFVDA